MALIRFSSTAALVRWLRLVGAPLRRRSQTFWTEVRGGRLLAGSTSEDGAARVEVMLQVGDSAPDDVRRWHRLGDHPTSQPARKSFDTRKGDKTAPDDTSPSAKTPFGEVVTPPPELLRHPLAQKVDRQLPGLLSEIKHHAGRYTLHWAAEGVWARLQLNVAPEVKQTKKASRPSKSAKASPKPPAPGQLHIDDNLRLTRSIDGRILASPSTRVAAEWMRDWTARERPELLAPVEDIHELNELLRAKPGSPFDAWFDALQANPDLRAAEERELVELHRAARPPERPRRRGLHWRAFDRAAPERTTAPPLLSATALSSGRMPTPRLRHIIASDSPTLPHQRKGDELTWSPRTHGIYLWSIYGTDATPEQAWVLRITAEGVEALEHIERTGDADLLKRARTYLKAASTDTPGPPPTPQLAPSPPTPQEAPPRRRAATGTTHTLRSSKAPKVMDVPGLGSLPGPQLPPQETFAAWRSFTGVGSRPSRKGEPRRAWLERYKGEDIAFAFGDKLSLFGLRLGTLPRAAFETVEIKTILTKASDLAAVLKSPDQATERIPDPAPVLQRRLSLYADHAWRTVALSRNAAQLLASSTWTGADRPNLQAAAWMHARGLAPIFGEEAEAKSVLWSTDGHRLTLHLRPEAPPPEIHRISRLALLDIQGEVLLGRRGSDTLALTRHTVSEVPDAQMPDITQVLPGTWDCFKTPGERCGKLRITTAMLADLQWNLKALRREFKQLHGKLDRSEFARFVLRRGEAFLSDKDPKNVNRSLEHKLNWEVPEGLIVVFDLRYVLKTLEHLGPCDLTAFDTLTPTLWRAGDLASVIMPMRV